MRLRLLLDTHALIWWFAVSERLSLPANHAISDETNDVLVSAASAWEIATKHRLGNCRRPQLSPLIWVAIAPASVLKNCLSPWTTPRAPGLCRSSTATPSTGCSSPRRWPATFRSFPTNRSSTGTASVGCGEPRRHASLAEAAPRRLRPHRRHYRARPSTTAISSSVTP